MHIDNFIADLKMLKEKGATYVYLDPIKLNIVSDGIEIYIDGFDDSDNYIGSVLAEKVVIEG